jgi:hypothetical protein
VERIGHLIRIVVRDAPGLAAAVEGMNLPVQSVVEPAHCGRVDPRSGRDEQAQRRRQPVDVLDRLQPFEHERDARKDRSAGRGGVLHELRRVERLSQSDAGPLPEQRHNQVPERVGVRQRNARQIHVDPLDAHRVDDVPAVVDQVQLRRHGRLRQVGRPRRELEDDGFAVIRWRGRFGELEDPRTGTETPLLNGRHQQVSIGNDRDGSELVHEASHLRVDGFAERQESDARFQTGHDQRQEHRMVADDRDDIGTAAHTKIGQRPRQLGDIVEEIGKGERPAIDQRADRRGARRVATDLPESLAEDARGHSC